MVLFIILNLLFQTILEEYIESTISGVTDPINKLMKITVLKWEALNWLKCVETKTNWEKCKDGYKKNGDGWIKEEVIFKL